MKPLLKVAINLTDPAAGWHKSGNSVCWCLFAKSCKVTLFQLLCQEIIDFFMFVTGVPEKDKTNPFKYHI